MILTNDYGGLPEHLTRLVYCLLSFTRLDMPYIIPLAIHIALSIYVSFFGRLLVFFSLLLNTVFLKSWPEDAFSIGDARWLYTLQSRLFYKPRGVLRKHYPISIKIRTRLQVYPLYGLGIFPSYSITAGCFTPPTLNFFQSLSTPSSTSGNGPMGVIALGLISP